MPEGKTVKRYIFQTFWKPSKKMHSNNNTKAINENGFALFSKHTYQSQRGSIDPVRDNFASFEHFIKYRAETLHKLTYMFI
jgi:hypothetical protein